MNKLSSKHNRNIHSKTQKSTSMILIIGIIFIAANLRAPLTSVGPLVSMIRDSLGISNTLAGMITTIPLLAFAIFSPFSPMLARKFGTRLVLFLSIIFLTIGIILRSTSGIIGVFVGTAILGLAISACNVLIPSLIKQDFSERVGVMTGIYSVSMNTFGALASGISIPIATVLGWSKTLAIWAILSFIAILFWIPQLKQRKKEVSIIKKIESTDIQSDASNIHKEVQEVNRTNLWKSPLAWQVTVFMGLQSLVFYSMVAWLPAILIQQGMNSSKAGWMLSLMQLALIPFTFIVSVLAGRKASQRSLVKIGSFCTLIGILGLLFGNQNLVFLWIIVLGIGGGFNFSLSMMFFSLRTKTADEAARLSGMAQSLGYLFAAFGPTLFGFLHDFTNSWTTPLIILIIVVILNCLVGLGAARNCYVGYSCNDGESKQI
ncbi:CynX/NimT family MFS transporter [Clostridium sp. FP1]|uniref:CynX/NimT family MFS transporter n=1 Tax=Clostridium sp. FP1 TaxID=2724076 RepID=UPI0013E954F3|nr:MFS transporter [Clostridium sp. FP1]MBZ9633370.1 MFS transporter [Clostridium sp. FP1]